MAAIIREVLNAANMELNLFVGGMSKVGVGLSGTWTGEVDFFYSTDGVNFVPLFMTPFASGTNVKLATGNGNWEAQVKNAVVVKAKFVTLTTGTVVVTMAAAVDSSYQDAFLVSTSKYVEQDATAGAANTITVAAQANRAWRVRTVSGGFSTAPGAAVKVTITDGASSVIWAEYVSASAGGWQLHLPLDNGSPGAPNGGVVGTPGNQIIVTIAAPGGSVATSTSCELIAA